MNAAEIIQGMGGPSTGGGCVCPVCGYDTLSVVDKDGKTLWRCSAGCGQEAVTGELKGRGLLGANGSTSPKAEKAPPPWKRPIDATYQYEDANGVALFEVVRFGDGQDPRFLQRRREGEKTLWNLKGVERVLYHLPEVLAAKGEKTIIVAEGEKDVDALRSLGFTATCNPGGALKWLGSYTKSLRDARVLIWGDNDEPGRKHAEIVARELHGAGKSIKVMYSPEPRKDASDWIEAGATAANIRERAGATLEWEPGEDEDVPDPIMEEINRDHAVVQLGGQAAILFESTDPNTGMVTVGYGRKQDLTLVLGNRFVAVGKKSVPAWKYWLEHPQRRQYARVEFAPGQKLPGDVLNLWRGFPVKPEAGEVGLYLDHVLNNIAGGDKVLNNYLLNYMGHAVQRPAELPETAIALRGDQGTGKSLCWTLFGELFGQHFQTVTDPAHLTGKHNEHLQDVIVLLAEESVWGGDRQAASILKSMITAKTKMIEPKFVKAFSVKNYTRLLLASNANWMVPAGLDERRFLVVDVADHKKQDREYFGKLVNKWNNGGREAFMYMLLNLPLHGVDIGKFPTTEALQDTIRLSMSPVEDWLYRALERGAILEEHGDWREWEPVPTRYIRTEINEGRKHQLSETAVGMELGKLVSIGRARPLLNLKREHCYTFPSLEACRQEFGKHTRLDTDWQRVDAENAAIPSDVSNPAKQGRTA